MISEFALLIFATLGAVGLYVAATLIPVKEKKEDESPHHGHPLGAAAASANEGAWKTIACLRGCGSRCMNRALVKNGVVVRQGARSWVPATGSRRTGAPGVHAYPRWLQQSDG